MLVTFSSMLRGNGPVEFKLNSGELFDASADV